MTSKLNKMALKNVHVNIIIHLIIMSYMTYVKPSNLHLLSSLIYHLLHIEKKISSIT